MRKTFFTFWILIGAMSVSAQSFEKISMKDLMDSVKSANHPIVLNVWATWCAPCVEELPYLNEGVAGFKEEGVELWLLSLDFARMVDDRLPKFIEKNGYTARYFWLTDFSADEFCPLLDPKWDGNIPVTYFYNPLNQYSKFLNRALTKAQVPLEIQAMLKK